MPTYKQIIHKQEINCENCEQESATNYCKNCGQCKQSRFTLRYLFGELLSIINYDKGFFYNFYHFSSSPTRSIISYLSGKTKPFYPPLPYFLTATTVLILLLAFGADYIGKHFADKVNYIFDVQAIEKEIDNTKTDYYKNRALRQVGLISLTKQIDSLREHEQQVTKPLADSIRRQVSAWLAESQRYQAHLKSLSKKDDAEADINKLKYGFLYLLPLFFALVGYFIFAKSKLFFTEHLIIHLYTLSQTIWFTNISLGVILAASWAYKLLYKASQISENVSFIYLIIIGLVSGGGLIFGAYIAWMCYKQGVQMDVKNHCANCGYESTAYYCANCGQRRQSRFTFKYILAEILAVLSYHKGILTNFVHLTLRPSKTIHAYLHGKTKPYYSPLSYFLTALTVGIVIFTVATASIETNEFDIFDDTEEVSKKAIALNYGKDRSIFEGRLVLLDSLYKEDYAQRPSTLSSLWHDLVDKDSTYRSFSYTSTINSLIVHNEDEIKALKKSDRETQVAIYAVFYGTPLYLSFLAFLLYFTKKLYFTEHLIIQLFLCGQGIWYSLLLFMGLVGVHELVVPIFIPDYSFSTLQTVYRIGYMIGYVVVLLGWYYYVTISTYRQTWWLVLLKCILMLFILAIMTLAASFLGVQLAGAL